MSSGGGSIADSVRRRLLNQSRERSVDYNLLLIRYVNERLLYRLSRSRYRDAFILKGAMAFDAWSKPSYRPTRDVDLLGYGRNEPPAIRQVFAEILGIAVEDDGLEFEVDSIDVKPIGTSGAYAGVQLRGDVSLGSARLRLHIDIGFGDAVIPEPKLVTYPTVLDQPAPSIRTYPPEAMIAEKFEAMVDLGIGNSRMKDFYDVWLLSDSMRFDRRLLKASIQATFDRRGTTLPTGTPLALSQDFATDGEKERQWKAFVARVGITDAPALYDLVGELREFLFPVLAPAEHNGHWEPQARAWVDD